MPSSDAFRPRLPIDPFATVESLTPWHVPQDLPHSPPQVILILGEPHRNDLLSLLTSPHLARSVLLIATHSPPPISAFHKGTPGPNVCILHLSSPLAVHENGALRLVKLLERAHRVAGRWRKSTQDSPLSLSEHRFVQLAESRDTGEFTVSEPFLFVDRYGKTVQSLSSPLPPTSFVQPRKFRLSSHSLLSPNGSPFSASTTSLPTSPTSSGKIQRKKLRRNSVTQPSPYSLSPPRQQDGLRAFDALLNFLPSGVPDKALLKHAILVTTLSAQYLAVPDRIGATATGDESGLNRSATSRFSAPRSSLHSFSASLPSSTSSSMSYPASGRTTPATSPSPSPPHTPSPFSQGPGESTNHLNVDAPKRKGTIKPSFAKRFSSFLHRSSSSATSAPAPPAIAGGTPGVRHANERMIDPPASGGYEYINTRPHGTTTKPKNAHLVHILPLDWVDWEEQQREESIRDPQQGKRRSSGPRYRDGSNPPDLSHRHHDVSGNVPSGSKRRTTGTSRVSAKPKLVQGIEQFLLTFAYPLGSLGLGPGSGESRPGLPSSSKSAHGHGDAKRALTGLAAAAAHAQTRPVPYLLAPGVFGRALDGAREEHPKQRDGGKGDYDHLEGHGSRRARKGLVIGEIILLGALDFDPEEAYGQEDAYKQEKDAYNRYFVEDRGNARAVGGGRAWVGVGDVICSKGEERKERKSEERVVVDKEDRDRRIRETERRLEASLSHKTSTSRATTITRKATQSQPRSQLPTPPDSSSSGESMEEDHPQDRHPPPSQPTRVYASTGRERQKDSAKTSRRGSIGGSTERQKDSATTSRRASTGGSTSERSRGDNLGPGLNPAPAPMSGQPWPSTEQGSTSRSTSKPASNGQPPPRPARNPLRSLSGTAPLSVSASAHVEGPATLPSASSPQESRQARTTPPPARDTPLSRPPSSWIEPPPPVTTRTQHEPKADFSARHTHGEQQPQFATRPRTAPISDSTTAAEAPQRNLTVRDRGDFQQETISNKLRKDGHDHGLGHAMRKWGLWKLKGKA